MTVPAEAEAGSELAAATNAESEPPTSTSIASVAQALSAFLMLVSVKTATDLLTNVVARPPATAMALVAEIAVFPLIVVWLMASNTVKRFRRLRNPSANDETRDIRNVFVSAVREKPLRLLGIGSVYAFDNLVYFFAQSNVGAVTYTVLAQTKIFFTVGVLRLRNMLGELRPAQVAGLALLFAGANLVALKDVAAFGRAASSGNRLLGIAALLTGQAATSAANVAYERRLREPGCDVWVRNVQLTSAITFWLAVSSLVRTTIILASGGTPPSAYALFEAFCAPWVWLVVGLKAATAVLIALTIKAGGNVLYAISKPWPVVFATMATWVALGQMPSIGFLSGVISSVAGILLFYASKAPEGEATGAK